MTRYDEVAYPSRPLPMATPAQLATQAVLRGQTDVPDPRTCRVLEIGCSDAGHLAWLAARAPEATFLGVDLSTTAVARAQERIRGLPNIEVRVGDLTRLEAGEFDFVLAHGVLSWLPDPGELMACLHRHLGPRGIAYVSYNVLPGAFLRRMVGDPMRRWSRTQPEPLAAARRLAAWVAAGELESPHVQTVRTSAELALRKPDHLLVHDDLAEHNKAFYFDQFVALAADHGLAYLADVHVADSQPPPGIELPQDLAALVAQDEVARQQLLDYARNRAFRESLVVRLEDAPTGPVADPARIEGLWAAAPVEHLGPDEGRTRVRLRGKVELTTDNVDVLADLADLAGAWPGSVPVSALRSDRATLLHLHAARALELRVDPCPAVRPADRPHVDGYARTRARLDGQLASLRHEPLDLEDELSRAAVAMMDGRTSRRQIAEALAGGAEVPISARLQLDALIDELGEAGLFVG